MGVSMVMTTRILQGQLHHNPEEARPEVDMALSKTHSTNSTARPLPLPTSAGEANEGHWVKAVGAGAAAQRSTAAPLRGTGHPDPCGEQA